MSQIRVLHVVPSLNIGGVEVGLLRSQSELQKSVAFRVFSVKGPGRLSLPSLTRLDILKLLLRRSERPHVVVTSLWLGHLVGVVLAFCCGARWVPFFHAARSEGWWRDSILRSAAHLSRFAFFDSAATCQYYKTHSSARSQIVPYRFAPPAQAVTEGRPFTCIFAGRLSREKRPDLLITYLSDLHRLMPAVRPLVLVSGEDKLLREFEALLHGAGVMAEVRFNVSPMAVVELMSQSALYLSFSDYEGFGMATIDAMSCGCVPIVRPVGEIASYVRDDCGILVADTSPAGMNAVAKQCFDLLKDAAKLRTFSERARLSVFRYRLYTESYLEGVRRAIVQL